jgi:DNA polymerase
MVEVVLPGETDFDAWRAAARRLRLAGIEPARVHWRVGEGSGVLFEDAPAEGDGAAFTCPRAFLDLAGDVLLHRDPHRLDLLYRLLWRLRDQPRLIEIVTDPDVAEALRLQKAVRQAIHKMHAFVRFRRVEDEAEETYVAWFEPPHHVTLAGADYFVRRMANLRFSILTPEMCVHWDGQGLSTTPGVDRAAAPTEDRLEAFWQTYYGAVFNPARLNAKVMTQHMARRYWRNLPEAALIPELVGQAQRRTHAMVDAAPTEPAPRAERIARRKSSEPPADPDATPQTLADLAKAVRACRRCELWRDATQGVPGEGPAQARLMLVGEQPGDREDLAGHAFVGPAGAMLNRALAEAGAPRGDVYVTNAVKHFRHEPRGKRRLHKTPNAGEVVACRWWLDNERRLVRPRVIVTLGATAAKAVLGRPVSVIKERGEASVLDGGERAFITVHPSYLLRLPDEAAKAAAYADFVRDLRAAYALAREAA